MIEKVSEFVENFWQSPAEIRLTFFTGGLAALALLVGLFLLFRILRLVFRAIFRKSNDDPAAALFETERQFAELARSASERNDEEAAREFLRRKVFLNDGVGATKFYVGTVIPKYPRLVLDVPQQMDLTQMLATHGEPAIALHAYENLFRSYPDSPQVDSAYLEAAKLCRQIPGRETQATEFLNRYDEVAQSTYKREARDLREKFAREDKTEKQAEPRVHTMQEEAALDWRSRLPLIEAASAPAINQSPAGRRSRLSNIQMPRPASPKRATPSQSSISTGSSAAPGLEPKGQLEVKPLLEDDGPNGSVYAATKSAMSIFEPPVIAQSETAPGNPLAEPPAHAESVMDHLSGERCVVVVEDAKVADGTEIHDGLRTKLKQLEGPLSDDIIGYELHPGEVAALEDRFPEASIHTFSHVDPLLTREPMELISMDVDENEVIFVGRSITCHVRYKDIALVNLAQAKLSARSTNYKHCLEIITADRRRFQAWERTLLKGASTIDRETVPEEEHIRALFLAIRERVNDDAIPQWLAEEPLTERHIAQFNSFLDYDNFIVALALLRLPRWE